MLGLPLLGRGVNANIGLGTAGRGYGTCGWRRSTGCHRGDTDGTRRFPETGDAPLD